ncbi:MAG: aminotransferase class I/II-fold pyridoxal phosphate-dependent enzyme [bacterium]|nr:aminotransferase class I/II-fold pyridoxal phosphate-dependent enzyme [bacterium]
MTFRSIMNQLPLPYSPASSLAEIASELGIPQEDILKLDAGENAYLPPLKIDWVAVTKQLAFYPDASCLELRTALAQELDLDRDMLVIGNGSDELIDLVCRLFLESGKTLVEFSPTFPMYRLFGIVTGATILNIPRAADFTLNLQNSIDAVAKADLVFLANPNNPTGTLISNATISKLLATGTPVVVDEAYFEFAGQSSLPLLQKYPNLIILRTFSKWAGMAGLRVGYLIANPLVIKALSQIKAPYSVNIIGQKVALIAVANRAKIMCQVAKQISARDWFINEVNKVSGWQAVPSRASCITLLPSCMSATTAAQEFRKRGILVKTLNLVGIADAIRINTAPKSILTKVLRVISTMKGC